MANVLLDTQGPPATPGAGQGIAYFDSVSKILTFKNDTGRAFSAGASIQNWNTADVVANAGDQYLTGSNLAVPPHGLQVGTMLRWRMIATKTGAGIATPIWSLRVGTAGSTADTARITFTGVAQTGVIDTAFIEVVAILRNTGAAGILAGGLTLTHHLAATGFATQQVTVLQGNSAGFDTTVANLILGLSVNPGAAGVWTHQVIVSEMLNI